MSSEQPEQTADRDRDALLRAACDESALTPALRARLADDDAMRAEFAETRDLVHELRETLRPEALPETLVQRIHARLDEQTVSEPPLTLRPFRVVWLAAAAALILALVGLWNWPRVSPEPIVLSADDAEVIVAACGVLDWGGQLEYSLERVSTELNEIEQRLERLPGTATYVPWGSEDDWDVAPDDRSSVSPHRLPPVCIRVEPHDLASASQEYRYESHTELPIDTAAGDRPGCAGSWLG